MPARGASAIARLWNFGLPPRGRACSLFSDHQGHSTGPMGPCAFTSTAAALLDTKQPNPFGLCTLAILLRCSLGRDRCGYRRFARALEISQIVYSNCHPISGTGHWNYKRVLLDIRSGIYSACCWNGAASRNGDRRLREPAEKSPPRPACPTAAQ